MSEKRHIPYLMDEHSISVYPTLAKILGNVNKAILVQQVHFLLNLAQQSDNGYVHVDDHWWVYNSYPEWQEKYFPWLSISTIKGLFGMLEHDGIIIVRQGVKSPMDRRKWYTINYDVLLKLIEPISENPPMHETKIVPSNGQKLSDEVLSSETPSETPSKEEEKKDSLLPLSPSEKPVEQPISEVMPMTIETPNPPQPAAPPSPAEPSEHTAIIAILDAWLEAQGSVKLKKYYAAKYTRDVALSIHKAGYTPEEVSGYVKWKKRDMFWQDKFIALEKVAEEVDLYRREQRRLHPPPPKPPDESIEYINEEERQNFFRIRDELAARMQPLKAELEALDRREGRR